MGAQAKDVCPRCPKCGSDQTRYTVKALHGRYCYCDACANSWYHEDLAMPPGQPPRTPDRDTNA